MLEGVLLSNLGTCPTKNHVCHLGQHHLLRRNAIARHSHYHPIMDVFWIASGARAVGRTLRSKITKSYKVDQESWRRGPTEPQAIGCKCLSIETAHRSEWTQSSFLQPTCPSQVNTCQRRSFWVHVADHWQCYILCRNPPCLQTVTICSSYIKTCLVHYCIRLRALPRRSGLPEWRPLADLLPTFEIATRSGKAWCARSDLQCHKTKDGQKPMAARGALTLDPRTGGEGCKRGFVTVMSWKYALGRCEWDWVRVREYTSRFYIKMYKERRGDKATNL